jgi:hypothetical protein
MYELEYTAAAFVDGDYEKWWGSQARLVKKMERWDTVGYRTFGIALCEVYYDRFAEAHPYLADGVRANLEIAKRMLTEKVLFYNISQTRFQLSPDKVKHLSCKDRNYVRSIKALTHRLSYEAMMQSKAFLVGTFWDSIMTDQEATSIFWHVVNGKIDYTKAKS